MVSKLRFGIIGTGGLARTAHIPAIKKMKQGTITAFCDVDKERVDKLARDWKVAEVYYDFKDLVNSKNVDAVIISSPNAYHREHSVAAAKAGKHVFCEKPLALNIKDAEEIVKTCKENKVKLQVGFSERFWNQVKIAKKLIEIGVIGTVKSFSSVFTVSDEDVDEIDTDFRDDLSLSGGGCIMDAGPHQVDMAHYMVGDITRVCAQVKHSVGGFCSKFEDNSLILCDFSSGAIGSILTNRFSPFMHRIYLYGTKGTIFIGTHTFFQAAPLAVYLRDIKAKIPEVIEKYFYPILVTEKPVERWVSITPPKDDIYVNQLDSFRNCIIKNTLPQVTGEDGISSLKVILGAYKSAEEDKWQEII